MGSCQSAAAGYRTDPSFKGVAADVLFMYCILEYMLLWADMQCIAQLIMT